MTVESEQNAVAKLPLDRSLPPIRRDRPNRADTRWREREPFRLTVRDSSSDDITIFSPILLVGLGMYRLAPGDSCGAGDSFAIAGARSAMRK